MVSNDDVKAKIIRRLEYIRDYCCLVDGTGNDAKYYQWIDEILDWIKAKENN